MGSTSGLFANLNQREMNFLEMYVRYRDEETGDYVPDWFHQRYHGELRAMSPVVLTYFLGEMIGKGDTTQVPFAARPIQLREAGYDKEEHRSISHREAGTPPEPLTFTGDPDPWGSYTQEKRYFQEAQRIYHKLVSKMHRRTPRDIEECDMSAHRNLDEYDREAYELWKGVELEGKTPRDVLNEMRGLPKDFPNNVDI